MQSLMIKLVLLPPIIPPQTKIDLLLKQSRSMAQNNLPDGVKTLLRLSAWITLNPRLSENKSNPNQHVGSAGDSGTNPLLPFHDVG